MVSEHGNNPELQRRQQRILFLLFILSPLARGSFWQPVYLRSQKKLLRAEQSRSWEKRHEQLAAALTAAPPTASILLKDPGPQRTCGRTEIDHFFWRTHLVFSNGCVSLALQVCTLVHARITEMPIVQGAVRILRRICSPPPPTCTVSFMGHLLGH